MCIVVLYLTIYKKKDKKYVQKNKSNKNKKKSILPNYVMATPSSNRII